MTRARALLPVRAAVALAIAVAGGLLAPAAASAADPDTAAAPLQITLDSVTPAAIPSKGPVRITGTVTNTSDAVWRSISLYPLTSATPFTTAAALTSATESDPNSVIGDRIVPDGRPFGKLTPGQSRPFTLTVRHRDFANRISGAPGVYWLGVHALGVSDTSGVDNIADGRVRTFLPLVPRRKSKNPVPVALVLQLRHGVSRSVDGSISDPKAWADDVAAGGPLGRLLSFTEAAGSAPLTWLVDPAVLAALNDLAHGNAGLGLALASSDGTPAPSPSASSTDAADPDEAAASTVYGSWLSSWTSAVGHQALLALPYADPDVSAIGLDHLNLLQAAWRLASGVLKDLSIKASRAIAPIDGYLDPRALPPQARGTTVVVGSRKASSGVSTLKGLRYAHAANLGGSADDTGLLDVRQQILADAAIRSLTRDRSPVVAVLPQIGSADTASDVSFFAPFETLGWVGLSGLTQGESAKRVALPWPAPARHAMIPDNNVGAANRLLATATTAGNLFDDEGAIGQQLTAMALGAASQQVRDRPVHATRAANAMNAAMKVFFNNIVVEGTDFVTLSGDNGNFTVSLYNGLNKAVKVGLAAQADDPKLKLRAPSSIQLAAGRRSTVRVEAQARTVGVHEVKLTPVTTTGAAVGRPFVFAVRTSQIGQVFWYVVLGGAAIVALMILRRARQRLRARRARA